MSHHLSGRHPRPQRSTAGIDSSQPTRVPRSARPAAQRGTDRAWREGASQRPKKMKGSRGGRGCLGLLYTGAGRGRERRGGLVQSLLKSPIGVVLAAFLVTLLVRLIVLCATGPSFSGLVLGWGKTTDTGALSAPAPLVSDASGFNAARIVDDEVFYDSQAMTREEIVTFPTRVNTGCQSGSDGTECLAGTTFSVPARQASAFRPGDIKTASGVNVADVIWEVSQACDIDP